MKKYKIVNYGEDCNCFDMELTDKELKLVIKLFEENNKCADYCCCPALFIYKYDKNKGDSYHINEDLCLNRGYNELKEESDSNE